MNGDDVQSNQDVLLPRVPVPAPLEVWRVRGTLAAQEDARSLLLDAAALQEGQVAASPTTFSLTAQRPPCILQPGRPWGPTRFPFGAYAPLEWRFLWR